MPDVKVTGFKLKQKIQQAEIKRDSLRTALYSSFTAFEGEEKEHPAELSSQLHEIESRIANLQTIQTILNNTINTQHGLLTTVVKKLGGATRLEQVWRDKVFEKQRRRAYYGGDNDKVRKHDEEYAKSVLTQKQLTEFFSDQVSYTATLREIIATENAREVTLKVSEELAQAL